MKFRDHTHALRAARNMEIEAIKLINFILIVLCEPVFRTRERIVLELHIRWSKWKPDQPLSDFGNATRCGMFHQWRLSNRKRVVRSRIHVPALNCVGALIFTKTLSAKRQKIDSSEEFHKRRLFFHLRYCECLKKGNCYQRYLAENYLRLDWEQTSFVKRLRDKLESCRKSGTSVFTAV